jgi:hypothetical protein
MIPRVDVESTLLLVCARGTFDSEQQTDLEVLLREDIDWERALLLAEKNYLLPLVAETLAAQPQGNVPPEVLGRLAAQRKALKFRAALFCDELLRLAELFESKGLSVLHYKGPICSDSLYGNRYRRTYFDLDFLVRRDELVSVCDLLRDEGYRCNIELSGADQGHFEREEKEYAFTSGMICLEPHFSLTANRFSFPVDYNGFWERSVSYPFGSIELSTFCPQDMLLILSIVGAKGQWKRLQMVCDIARAFCSIDPATAERVLVDAKACGCERIFLLASHLANSLFGASVPDAILKEIKRDSKAIGKLTRRIVAGFFEPKSEAGLLGHSPHIFSPLIFSMRERLRDRIHYLLQTTTTPTAAHLKRFRLPTWAFPAYRVLTPLHDYVLMPGFRAARLVPRRIKD